MLEVSETLRVVHHDGEDAETHPVHPGEAELRSRRLADAVVTETPIGPILDRGLEPGAWRVHVDPARLHVGGGARAPSQVGVTGEVGLGRLAQTPGQLRAERRAEVDQPGRHGPRHRPRQVDDVSDDHEVPGRQVLATPPVLLSTNTRRAPARASTSKTRSLASALLPGASDRLAGSIPCIQTYK